MKTKNVLVLDSDVAFLNDLKGVLESREGVSVMYAGDDGENGIRRIRFIKPDLALVGMFLKGADGSDVIQAIRKESGDIKIIATGEPNDALMEKAMRAGADFYLMKPFSTNTVVERIKELLREKESENGIHEYAGAGRRTITLDERISTILISMGTPPNLKGYGCVREAIKTAVNNPAIMDRVTKGLYFSVAEKLGTTPSKVERAIRHAIEVTWSKGRIDEINDIFGARVYIGTEKPTNSEFIALIADKLILEGMAK